METTQFDIAHKQVLNCGILAIVKIGFRSLLTMVRLVTCIIGGLFNARSFSSLYGGLNGGASARRSLGYGLLIPFNLPPEFRSPVGRNLTNGASL